MNHHLTDQGSEEWIKLKLGVASASNASKILAKKGSETRNGYLAELVAQVATQEMPEFNAKSLEFGKNNESAARSAYEFITGHKVNQAGFIYGPGKRTGCSPDGLVDGISKGLEIKCPFTSKVHVEFLTMDKIKPEYLAQIHFSLFLTGLETWDFCSFDARFKSSMLKIHTIERSAEWHERLTNEVGEFITDMDKMLDRLGVKWGSQWD